MSDLCIFTIFDSKTKRPRCTGIRSDNRVVIKDLYRPGSGKIIRLIEENLDVIRNIILSNTQDNIIKISDFKSHLFAFNLPLDQRDYHVYDFHLPDIKLLSSGDCDVDRDRDFDVVRRVLDKMSNQNVYRYQRIISEAAVVYQDLENIGLEANFNPVYPKWSQKTFSGRSKTTQFNIQGLSEPYGITQSGWSEYNTLVHFDWICADIRVASLLSQDERLSDSFKYSDPYTVTMNELNNGSDEKISREESKRYLLKSINSMDFTSDVLLDIYPHLGKWIQFCRSQFDSGYLKTILDRKFKTANAKNELAVLNGVMQGSVAHAMQLVVRNIWKFLPGRLVAEIHDSLVVSTKDGKDIRSVIDIVTPIMLYPFDGVLENNPIFPLKVSIGKKWKTWKLFETHRESGVVKSVTKT